MAVLSFFGYDLGPVSPGRTLAGTVFDKTPYRMGENGQAIGTHVRFAGALAGIGSGLTKVAVGHGFDTIKTRVQCSPPATYDGAIDALKILVRNEGVFALYKGATPPAVGSAAIDSLLLGSLHNYRLMLLQTSLTEDAPGLETTRLTLLGHGVAGMFAGLTSTILATPVELLKVKLQIQTQRSTSERQFKGPIDCARQIIRSQGVIGMWTGLTGSLVMRSNFFWMFLSFEAYMRAFAKLQGTKFEISTGLANFLSGGLGSFGFWFMAIPADNVKNRMMAQPLTAHDTPGPVRQSFMKIARQIYSTDGLKGFSRGLGPSLLRSFPVNASAIFVYEGTMRALGAEKTRAD